MLGTRNETKEDHSGLKNHNSRQNRHVKCNKSCELEKIKKQLMGTMIFM
ncbi:hypothetical protein Ccrd_008255 [Cynara cardunculus var. scolymus]|uniref:Uncharacterized protein n=1 Tax=Cynara cardunculus var. scolymus TaxID=59895 RepID=A0A103XFG5_CYNCS|nr:hypothetical protein Ccrd_008255 [Cynara cardunculus var. scolymus]